MASLHQANVSLKVTESVCGFVALLSTVIRLYIRRSRYWWDDAWVVFSVVFLLVQVAGAFMHVDHENELSKAGHIAAYYILATTFYCIIWAARLSILFSIIRIDPDPRWQRRLKYIAALFIFALLFFLSQVFWVCEPTRHIWEQRASPQCSLGKEVAICQVVSDVIADLLLIILPIRLIRGITDKGLQRRLVFIFSTAIITTIVSLVHAAFIINEGTTTVLVSALVEDCMSLTVANVPVVVTALLRKLDLAQVPHTDQTTTADDGEGKHWANTFLKFRSSFPGGATTQGSSRWWRSTRRGRTTTAGEVTTGRWGGGTSKWGAGTAATGTTGTTASVMPDGAEDVFGVSMGARAEKMHVFLQTGSAGSREDGDKKQPVTEEIALAETVSLASRRRHAEDAEGQTDERGAGSGHSTETLPATAV